MRVTSATLGKYRVQEVSVHLDDTETVVSAVKAWIKDDRFSSSYAYELFYGKRIEDFRTESDVDVALQKLRGHIESYRHPESHRIDFFPHDKGLKYPVYCILGVRTDIPVMPDEEWARAHHPGPKMQTTPFTDVDIDAMK